MSVSALVIVISVMTALNISIQDRTLAVEPHLRIELPEVGSDSMLIAQPIYQKLVADKELKVHIFESQDVIIRTMEGHFRGAIARGMSRDSFSFVLEQMRRISQSRKKSAITQFEVEELVDREVAMGSDLAISLGIFEGDHVMIVPPESLLLPPGEAPPFEKVKVKRILSTNLADVDAQNIFYIRGEALISLRDAASKRTGIEVWMKDPFHAEELKESLKKFSQAKVDTWKDRNSALFLALKLEKFIITTFLSLAAVVAGLSMISVLALLISQKMREIGILLTMGMSARRVRDLFQKIGFFLGCSGLVMGLLFGIAVSLYLQFFPLNVLPHVYYDSEIPAKVKFGFVLTVTLVGLFFCWLGSRIASSMADTAQPSRLLRQKV